VAILGVLGGAFNGGFCCALACGQARACKACWGRLKETRGGRCFRLHYFNSLVFKKPFYSFALFCLFRLSLFPPSTLQKQRQNFPPHPKILPKNVHLLRENKNLCTAICRISCIEGWFSAKENFYWRIIIFY
jgi:hypothetical protein